MARRATLASLLRRAADGIWLCEHLDGADGETVGTHARSAVSVRALTGIGLRSRTPRHRRQLG